MASFVKYQQFVEDLGNKVHDLVVTNDTLKIALTNTAPNVATHAVLADITEISAGNGYTAGGAAATVTSGAQASGVFRLILADPATWTATGSVGPFRYAVLYNDTPSSPADPLIGWWDYGSSITLSSGETFAVDFDGTNGVLTLQ